MPEPPNDANGTPSDSTPADPQPNGAPDDTAPMSSLERVKPNLTVILIGILFYVAVGIVIALFFKTSREFVFRWWWGFGIALVGLVVFVIVFGGIARLKQASPGARAAVVVFLLLPSAMALIGLIGIVVPPDYQVTALRSVFLLITGLLPGSLWWLFIAQRKSSLLNEWVADLSHLGLLERQENEQTADKDRRITAYYKKFEAAYGSLSKDQIDAVVAPSADHWSVQSKASSAVTTSASMPVVIATVLIAIGWLVVLPPVVGSELPSSGGDVLGFLERWLTALRPAEDAVAFAFVGAYFYTIQMLFRRYVLSDLQATAYVAVTIRVLLAVIGTWAVVIAFDLEFDDTSAMVLGFLIGVFPSIALQAIENVAKRVTGVVLRIPSLRPGFPLSEIDGLTVWHQTRLEEEDIENVPSLATSNLPDLLLRTRYSADRVVDWIDQAILFTALGDPLAHKKGAVPESQHARDILRRYGVRTATSLIRAEEMDLRDDLATDDDRLAARLPFIVSSVRTNQNLRLVENWQEIKPRRRSSP